MGEEVVPLFKGKDGRLMVSVPAGEFLFGPDREKASTGAFYIDRFPVTNAEYKQFVEATHWEEPAHWRRGTWPEGKADHPVTQVTWDSASAYAQWAGKRLPTEVEWEKAARGTDGRIWPWGSVFDRDKCNTSESEIWDTTPVGKYSPAGDSPYGAAEWRATCTSGSGQGLAHAHAAARRRLVGWPRRSHDLCPPHAHPQAQE